MFCERNYSITTLVLKKQMYCGDPMYPMGSVLCLRTPGF